MVVHLRIDFNGGNVSHLVDILHGGVVRFSVGQLDTHASLVGDNMGIGDDETVTGDDEARTIRHRDLSPGKWVPIQKNGR